MIKTCVDEGVQLGLVIGGGNFWRGRTSGNMDRTRADSMGMLATVINSLELCSALEAIGQKVRVMTSVRMEPIGELYSTAVALRLMAEGNVVIIAGGTGNPYFTTDTASVLRAIEIQADVMMKGTRVDGIYTADPEKDPTATKFDEITYDEMLELATSGAKVLHNRSVEMAKKYGVELVVRSSLNETEGTVVKEVVKMEKMLITGVAADKNTARISVIGLEDKPGIAFKVFHRLAKNNINIDIFNFNFSN